MATEQKPPLSRKQQLELWQAQKGEESAKPKSKSHGNVRSSKPKGGASPGKEIRRTSKDKPKSSKKSNGRRKKTESLKATEKNTAKALHTPTRHMTTPQAGDEHAVGEEGRGGADARLPKGIRSSTKTRHETLPQDRSHLDDQVQEGEYKGDPIMSPEPFHLFSPLTRSQKGTERGKRPVQADVESSGDVLNLVRDEIDRLADGIDALDKPLKSPKKAGTRGEGKGDSASSELRPSDFTDRIVQSLEIMGQRADMMAEALERNYARTEALEKENKVLREMLQRLVKDEHKDFMTEMLSTVSTMKTALSPDAAAKQRGKGTLTGDGGRTAGPGVDTTTLDTAMPNADVEISDETAGTKFVADLSEVMSIQTGHHGLLAGIMDRHLAMEAKGADVDTSDVAGGTSGPSKDAS